MTPATLASSLREARILAVITIGNPADAAELGRALLDGGIRAVELTLRTPAALEALRALRAAVPELLVGAGTVLTPAQAEDVLAAGAAFALAPGFDPATVRRCGEIGLPFVPGVATASEIQAALGAGCRLLKLFPAEPLGGVRGLRTLAAPFAHLGVSFVPLGGIDPARAPAYLAEPLVTALGGSWIATPELIRERAWETIRRQAAEASALVRPAAPHFS